MESQSHEHFMPYGIANPNHIASVTRQDPLSSWMKEVNSNFLTKRELFAFKKKQPKLAQVETRHWRQKQLVSFCKTKYTFLFFCFLGELFILAHIWFGSSQSWLTYYLVGPEVTSLVVSLLAVKFLKDLANHFFNLGGGSDFSLQGAPACFLVFLSLNQKT